ncbi:unnamed protein product [Arabidopsis thaliana]|uniref:(thale cress) hypothetical protein n=1 Tax=Arabidopsis thaliana TaxID=3702 RepID=A0A7G2EIR3_ARATH|nr:unnamed protein product [Arabidopsis thaliana]
MWREGVDIRILESNKRMIDVKVCWQGKDFFLTCVYGEPVQSERGDFWEKLSRIGLDRNHAWMLTGDFNELVDPSEKLGGAVRRDSSCREFRQMLTSCGLWEIKHIGYQYSWFGNRNDELVQCRLDRTVANSAWIELFPQAQTTYLQKICSDHSPLINSLMGMNWKSWAGFKYDKRWVHREGFTDLMARFWSQTAANTESSMMEKIASCRKEISQWKRRCKPSSAVRIQELQFRIDAATRQIPFNPQLLKDLRKELNHEYYQEEQFWSQKSRVTWFNEGDKNTKFFHATTKNRRAQNRIQKLIDDDGNEWLTDAQLGKVAEAYFRKLFASEDIGYQSIHEAQDLIKQGIRVVIGNGASTNIWKDPWISSKPAKGVLSTRMLPQGLHHSALNLSFVKDLIVDQGREWNLELLRSLFPEEVVSSISQIRLGACNTKDCFAWDYSLDGQYSVKSGYWVQMQVIRQERGIREVLQPSLSPIYHQIWSSDNPPKIQHFLWRCVSNCLSVAGNLYHRHLARDGACARCPNHVESVNHLLFTCSFARLVWAISPIPAPPGAISLFGRN